MDNFSLLIFKLVVLILSAVVHEVSHGAVAYRLGDNTAKDAGRLTLNPLKHLDPIGSFFFPFILFLVNSPVIFGWAKPVPFNPYNLRDPKKGAALIGAAGPASNIIVALFFGLLIRVIAPFLELQANGAAVLFIVLLEIVVVINLMLAVFNMMPIPPLDGSKVLFGFLPARYYKVQQALERYGMIILLAFIFFGIGLIIPIIFGLFNLIVGPYASLLL